jgi:kinesin family protein 5
MVGSERVMVHLRMRPFSEEELKKDKSTPIENFDPLNNSVTIKKDFDKKNYNFDSVINMNSKQKDVYENTAHEVVDVN